MDDNEKRSQLIPLIGQFVNKTNVAKVVDWIIESRYSFPEKGRSAIEDSVVAYEKATGKRVYWPENCSAVYNYIVRERFGFATDQALREQDDRLANGLWVETTGYREWRGGTFAMTEFDQKYTVEYAANIIYKLLEPKLSDAHRAYKKQSFKARYQHWDTDKLKVAIVDHLREHRREELNQDQIANALQAQSAFVFRVLETIVADTTLGIITYKANRKSEGKHSASRQVYKYAPQRIALTQAKDRNSYLHVLVKHVLRNKPGIPRSQVFTTLKKNLGQLDNKKVYEVLDEMIAAGEMVCEGVADNNARLCWLV